MTKENKDALSRLRVVAMNIHDFVVANSGITSQLQEAKELLLLVGYATGLAYRLDSGFGIDKFESANPEMKICGICFSSLNLEERASGLTICTPCGKKRTTPRSK